MRALARLLSSHLAVARGARFLVKYPGITPANPAPERGKVARRPTKTTASRRRVPLTLRALEALDELPTRLDTRLLFPGERGGYLNLRNWRAREWDVAIETAGLGVCECGHPSGGGHDGGCQHPRCGCIRYRRSKASPVPYVLRHTFASNALAAGVGTFELARYMGSSVEMIERTYGHLVAGTDESFRSRLDAFAAAGDGVEVASSGEGESR